MSNLEPGDEELHYSDGSHRWASPDGRAEDTWRSRVATHVGKHLDNMADSPRPAGRRRPGEDPRAHG